MHLSNKHAWFNKHLLWMHVNRFKYTVNHVNANHFKNKGKLYYIKQKHDCFREHVLPLLQSDLDDGKLSTFWIYRTELLFRHNHHSLPTEFGDSSITCPQVRSLHQGLDMNHRIPQPLIMNGLWGGNRQAKHRTQPQSPLQVFL